MNVTAVLHNIPNECICLLINSYEEEHAASLGSAENAHGQVVSQSSPQLLPLTWVKDLLTSPRRSSWTTRHIVEQQGHHWPRRLRDKVSWHRHSESWPECL